MPRSQWLRSSSIQALIMLGATIIRTMFLQILILYIVVAAIDFMFQRKNFANDFTKNSIRWS